MIENFLASFPRLQRIIKKILCDDSEMPSNGNTKGFRRLQIIGKKILFYSKKMFFNRSYSQFGEDLLLQGFLGKKWSWNYKGFYVDIGAHHPTRLSNTKIYYDAGWRGINVDASCEAIKAFKRVRRRDVNVNVGIGKEAGMLDYYRMSSSPMNTFSKDFAEHAITGGGG